MNEQEIAEYINKYLTILNNNFTTYNEKKIPYNDIRDMMEDLQKLFASYYKINEVECSKLASKKYIPLLNLMLKIDKRKDSTEQYFMATKEAYRMAARTSLEAYFMYREWEEPYTEKFFAPRIPILKGYIHYLEEIALNPKFRLLIANLPSGYGKTFTEKISEAWNFGVDPTGTVLSLCSNDDVVKSGSRTVRDEMKSEWFGEVFPKMKWNEEDKDYFLKETDGRWKLKQCRLGASYVASTTNSNVVGDRASQRIHIDDLYADYQEAMGQNLNEYYFNKFLTVWRKRFVQNKEPKVVVTGTLWASGDFIALLIETAKKENKFRKHPKYPYTYINEDETIAIVQVPALDYETGLSTCPELRTTEQIEAEKRNIPEYLFETNFQQRPTDPDALLFSYNILRTYTNLPAFDSEASYAVIDATRKTGKDYFSMPIFKKSYEEEHPIFYLTDCLFTQKATKDLYQEICDKIIQNHIVELVIESNVTTELSQNISKILEANGVFYCKIREKYNVENKGERIIDQSFLIQKRMVFPAKDKFPLRSEMGQFMNNLTLYNSTGRNQHDDSCFDGDTLIATKFGYKKIKDIKIGDKVITPFGLRKVINCGITGYKETINKFGLNVTPDHKVYSKKENKFIPIDSLTLLEESDTLSLKGMIKWKQKLLNLTGKFIKDTQRADIILCTQQEMKKEKIQSNCMLQFGNITTEKCQKGIMYIIKTKIMIIMTFLTWFVFLLGNTYHNIAKKIGKMKNTVKKELKECKGIAKLKKNVEHGTKVKKEEHGIDNMQKTQFLKTNLEKKENVNIVEKNILQKINMQNIALQNVDKKELIYQKQTYAKFVEKNFIQQDISLKHVQENVKLNCKLKPVYNITVENAGCYYANNILVSNCDSLAMFTKEFIDEGTHKAKITIFKRPF